MLKADSCCLCLSRNSRAVIVSTCIHAISSCADGIGSVCTISWGRGACEAAITTRYPSTCICHIPFHTTLHFPKVDCVEVWGRRVVGGACVSASIVMEQWGRQRIAVRARMGKRRRLRPLFLGHFCCGGWNLKSPVKRARTLLKSEFLLHRGGGGIGTAYLFFCFTFSSHTKCFHVYCLQLIIEFASFSHKARKEAQGH